MSITLETIAPNALREKEAVLGERELEILRMVARGYMTKQIADHLGTSQRTVDHQRATIMAKMRARTPAHLVFLAYSKGLLS